MMARHHIIPRHEWSARFGNLKGFNALDNIVDLYTEQHAHVHIHYFNEITHIEYDRIASLAISKQIGKEEAQKLASSIANSSRSHASGFKRGPMTIEHRNKLSIANIGKKHTIAHREKQSLVLLGNKRSLGYKYGIEARENMSRSQMGKRLGIPQRKVVCPHCGKIGGYCVMKRYHFERCLRVI
jgi:hypothetical protein